MIPLPGPWGGIRNPSKNLRNFLPHNFLLMVFHRKIHTLELKSIQQKVPKKLVCLKMKDPKIHWFVTKINQDKFIQFHENLVVSQIFVVSQVFVDDTTRSKVQIYSKPPRDILQEGAKPYDRRQMPLIWMGMWFLQHCLSCSSLNMPKFHPKNKTYHSENWILWDFYEMSWALGHMCKRSFSRQPNTICVK